MPQDQQPARVDADGGQPHVGQVALAECLPAGVDLVLFQRRQEQQDPIQVLMHPLVRQLRRARVTGGRRRVDHDEAAVRPAGRDDAGDPDGALRCEQAGREIAEAFGEPEGQLARQRPAPSGTGPDRQPLVPRARQVDDLREGALMALMTCSGHAQAGLPRAQVPGGHGQGRDREAVRHGQMQRQRGRPPAQCPVHDDGGVKAAVPDRERGTAHAEGGRQRQRAGGVQGQGSKAPQCHSGAGAPGAQPAQPSGGAHGQCHGAPGGSYGGHSEDDGRGAGEGQTECAGGASGSGHPQGGCQAALRAGPAGPAGHILRQHAGRIGLLFPVLVWLPSTAGRRGLAVPPTGKTDQRPDGHGNRDNHHRGFREPIGHLRREGLRAGPRRAGEHAPLLHGRGTGQGADAAITRGSEERSDLDEVNTAPEVDELVLPGRPAQEGAPVPLDRTGDSGRYLDCPVVPGETPVHNPLDLTGRLQAAAPLYGDRDRNGGTVIAPLALDP